MIKMPSVIGRVHGMQQGAVREIDIVASISGAVPDRGDRRELDRIVHDVVLDGGGGITGYPHAKGIISK